MNDEFSPEEEVLLEELIMEYRELCQQVTELQKLRAKVAKKIVEIICPLKIGDFVRVSKPNKRFNEPVGVCQVIEIIPIGHNSDAPTYHNQPGFTFAVKKVLSSGELSQITHVTYMPSRWRKVK